MARKTRVSFIKGMMVTAATKELKPESRQILIVLESAFTTIGSKASTMRAKHPPRTASHKPAKNAVTHGFPLNMARVRKKKRRDVNTRTAHKKTTTSLSMKSHVKTEDFAEENQRLVMNLNIFENLSSRVTVTNTVPDIVNPKQHNL